MVKKATQVETNDAAVVLIQPQWRHFVHLPPLQTQDISV